MKKSPATFVVLITASLPLLSALAMLLFWLAYREQYHLAQANTAHLRDVQYWWYPFARTCDRWLWLWLPLAVLISISTVAGVLLYKGNMKTK